MKVKSSLLILSLITIVFIAGCIGQQKIVSEEELPTITEWKSYEETFYLYDEQGFLSNNYVKIQLRTPKPSSCGKNATIVVSLLTNLPRSDYKLQFGVWGTGNKFIYGSEEYELYDFSTVPLEVYIIFPVPKEPCVDKVPVSVFAELNAADLGSVPGYIYTT